MATSTRFLTAGMLVLASLAALAGDRDLDKKSLAKIQEAVRELRREVEYLHEDIVTEMGGKAERVLFRQAGDVLAGIGRFQESLKAGVKHELLHEEFDGLDRELHELLKALRALPAEQRLLKRTADRVERADDTVHFALFGDGGSEKRAKPMLKRQARALKIATRELKRTANFGLGYAPEAVRAILIADLEKLADAAERFEKGLGPDSDRRDLRKSFAAVNQAWERVTRGLPRLKPQHQYLFLLRNAERVDDRHERLFRLLGIEGERPGLTVRT